MIEQINEAVDFIRQKIDGKPEVGVILGTGLGNAFVAGINVEAEIPYGDIPNFPTSTVEFHKGKLIYGELKGKKIIAMQGRMHHYEGYTTQQVTFPVRVMKFLGIKCLLISNASGNINLSWKTGEMMLIDDHINLLPNPLIGKNDNELGPRFPDMSAPYDKKLNGMLEEIAREKSITLRKGVFVAVSGPTLETRAEYRYLRIIGADAVGMSTTPEVIVANHMSLPCCGISVFTDTGDPDNLKPVDIDEIIAIAGKAEGKLTELFTTLIERL
ncbi:MAG: purine-nucleoside phosphorylase [Candidatus Cyclobacteriaceae bacterium M2_1C_046]